MRKYIQIAVLALCLIRTAPLAAQESFAPLVEKVMPMVVNISTRLIDQEDRPNVIDNLLFRSDGHSAFGAGFVVSADGYIVTNRHVIENSSQIWVRAADEKAYPATVAGIDFGTDLALLKIQAEKPLESVIFGSSESVRVGDRVLAVGNPFGLNNSVTAGIISAKNRDIGDNPYDDYLQTDAAINQGNSGGPMFNTKGELIGMNTAIFSENGLGGGVGFALPSDQIKWVVDQLRTKGTVERSFLGVVLKDKTDAKGASHVVVSALTPEYNADFVGLQVGDVILEKDHTPLKSAHRFSVETARLPVGTDIILTIRRNGKNDEIMVKTLLWPNVEPTKEEPLAVAENMLPYDQKDALYGLKTDHMVILSVKEDSQAALKGIKKGDRIVRVQNKAAVDDLDLAYYMKDARNSRTPLRLDLEDLQGESYFVELTPEGEIEHDAD